MKIVIDIEEGRYNWIMSHASNHPNDYANTTDIVFRKAVESGIVLPKGHGRLIDADAYISEINRAFPCNDRDDTNIRRATEIGISGAPILIDADN